MPVQRWIINSLNAVFLSFALLIGAGQSAAEAQVSGQGTSQNDCPGPVYDTGLLSVDQTAQTGQLARTQAMGDITTAQFERILGRILLTPDADKTPALTRLLSTVNPADFVDFVQIDDETVLPGRYIANLRICFNQTKLREALLAEGLEFAEAISPPVLVLPLFAEPTGVRLFMRSTQRQRAQSQNAWFDGWQQAISDQQGLVSLVALENSLSISRKLREEDVYQTDPSVLALAAQSSGAAQLLWVLAELDYSQQTPQLILDARLFDGAGGLLAPIAKRRFVLNGQHNMNLLFLEFQSEILATLETEWRRANLVSFSAENELILAVPFSDFAEWYDTQRKIGSLPVIIQVTPLHLDGARGYVKLTPAGSLQAVESAFASLGFSLRRLDNYQLGDRALTQLLLSAPTAN